jgi:cell division protein ZapE
MEKGDSFCRLFPSCSVSSSWRPPERLSDATFSAYRAQTAGQQAALAATRHFVQTVRTGRSWTDRLRRWVGAATEAPHGLYLVGPVGTGKTHLLAAAHHALTPEVPCAFVHSSTLFRLTEHPARFAERLAAAHRVCCLDEVEIDDPANEARLVHVLRVLERADVRLLATSNVAPEAFMAQHTGPSRFQQFLANTFRERYRLIEVDGPDHRRTAAAAADGASSAPGRAWIGPAPATRRAMQAAYAQDDADKQWMTFEALQEAATTTAHETLVARLAAHDSLYLADVRVSDTDAALRLLRLVDALHVRTDAPRLYLTAETPPEDWFAADAVRRGVEQQVAKKFERTVSRLHALCTIEHVEASASS